jgi:hypothetical protein
MNASIRSKIVFPIASALALFALSAHAEEPAKKPPAKAAVQTQKLTPGRPGPVAGQGQAPQPGARVARGALPARNFSGQPYRGRVAWEGGRWHHEVRDGRDGWWWDVGGAYYYYPQPMEGPPTYISEDFVDDAGPPVAAAYPPPDAYAPPPAPPPPDPGASAVGGAIVGGLLGGLLTGRASGAAIGAVAGGATGAIAGSQPGYYLSQGNCYYRYPSGQYVLADPRACY